MIALRLAALTLLVTAAGCSQDPVPAPSSTTPLRIDRTHDTGVVAQISRPANAPAATDAVPLAASTTAPSPAGGGVGPVAAGGPPAPAHLQDLGDAVVHFRAQRSLRTGRALFEYHFEVSVENTGGGLLRGIVRVTSGSDATRVVVGCVPLGTTPPGTTRGADGAIVLAQRRDVPFDPASLTFRIEASGDATCEDPGRVTLRRLNRSEYDNTMRDLLGTEQHPARDFPADDFGYGFDTIADVLALSPLLFERLEVSALALVETALRANPAPAPLAGILSRCDPAQAGAAACGRQILAAFARRAWRRPPTGEEIEALGLRVDAVVAGGGDFQAGLAEAMQAALVSPHFVFRVERDAHGRSAEIHPLSDHELATRLSYFLWSSMPDPELDALADSGALHRTETIAAQVHRMIQDPRAQGFIDDFAGQWLATRALDDANPEYVLFPNWGEPLKQAMRLETHLFFADFVRAERSFLDFFDAEFSYVNDVLAAHYQLPLPGSDEMVRVDLPPDSHRGGIFTHASLLTITSHPRRTSPVKRGKWALDQMLCIAIDPPPAGVEGFLKDPSPSNGGTLAEQLAQHRARPECASCHNYLDPIGLGLENYGPTGAWRSADNGGPIDASGRFPDGQTFAGPAEMAAIVKASPNTPRCIAERVMTYAIGRGLGSADEPHLDAVVAAFAEGGHRFESLLIAVAQSPPFRMRRGETEEAAP